MGSEIMAKDTTYQIVGDIIKGIGYNRKQWGVEVLWRFADGREVKALHTGDRKKDIVAAMQPGALNDKAKAAQLDAAGRLSFQYVFDFGGLRPSETAFS